MRIYLDHNATTPLLPEVLDAMLPWLREGWGNPSSPHAEGARARAAVEAARGQVARLLSVPPDAVCFCGGATEANNTVLRGVVTARPGGRFVTTAAEHPSVEEPAVRLEKEGHPVARVAVDGDGRVDPERLADALRPDTALVSVLWANNETGVIQPMAEIAAIAREHGVPIHADATQALGKLPVDLARVPLDFASCTAHKLGGPKGVGAWVAAGGCALEPLLLGGPQEKRRRGGTENVAGIVGFGAACEAARQELDERIRRYAALRDRLWDGLRAQLPGLRWNGRRDVVLPNTLNVEIEGTPGELVLQALDLEGVAVSAGAACHSGAIAPSHVLSAMGRTREQARSSLRLSVGHGLDAPAIDAAVERIVAVVGRVRASGAR